MPIIVFRASQRQPVAAARRGNPSLAFVADADAEHTHTSVEVAAVDA